MQTRQELLRRILAMPGVVAMAGPLPEPVRITCEPDGIW